MHVTQGLIRAVTMGNIPQIEKLLKDNVSINCKEEDGDTPLHIAAATGREDVLKLLIDNGASLHSVDVSGNLPEDDAQDNGHEAIFIKLRELRGESINPHKLPTELDHIHADNHKSYTRLKQHVQDQVCCVAFVALVFIHR